MILRYFYTLILLCSFLTVSYAETKEHHVQLLQKGTKSPVQYANICWQILSDSSEKGNVVSDYQGNFKIPNFKNRDIVLAVSCIGYKPIYDTLKISALQPVYMEKDVLNLNQVTVTGTRTPYTLKKAPVLTQVISAQEIESVDSEIITDVLQFEMPGIALARHGGVPVMNMMGLETQYSLVLVDGERMAKGLHKTIDYNPTNEHSSAK